MEIQELNKNDIIKAFEYIDENGIPRPNQIRDYKVVTDNGKEYPPKYVIAVAQNLKYGKEISTDDFNSIQARSYLKELGFQISNNNENSFELVITADNITSTDPNFDINDLYKGDSYKPVDTYFLKSDGSVITRKYRKGEKRKSNQTLPKLAIQIFENDISNLTEEEKLNFPVCKYRPNLDWKRGIFKNIEEFQNVHTKTIQYLTYYGNNQNFIIYCWNIFSTLYFVQECLKRFGNPNDQFILNYEYKDFKESEDNSINEKVTEELSQNVNQYNYEDSFNLINSKNLIIRGAPGTGKTYLAKRIAADVVSFGACSEYSELTEDQKSQIDMVQFHPNYDYSDFIEGLRPIINEDGTMSFELHDGTFKEFVSRARKNYENVNKPKETIEKEYLVDNAIDLFLSNIDFDFDIFRTVSGNKFSITNVTDNFIYISIPDNNTVNKLTLSLKTLKEMLEADKTFKKIKDITNFFNQKYTRQSYSYYFALYKEISKLMEKIVSPNVENEELKNYVFIIDEINRGEMSKIFGELFFSIDPEYRGKAGQIKTQYSNLHEDPEEKFYVPSNVYIIGTMNDIDRSVDSFDFAMRRRFRFIELKANNSADMLTELKDEELENEAINRMTSLNNEILKIEDLNEDYQIGASYFLKLEYLNFDELWTDYLKPLLQEYIRGMYNESEIMENFAKAYGYGKNTVVDENEDT